jgi:hypothetical protein
MKNIMRVWEQKNARITEAPKAIKIPTKKSKMADCPNCKGGNK